ncbi:hypothetical protein [Cyclobacterium xiamenense]|jgi:hypothetical protein|uniref:hypothetical protein n=1 Tax=Cyclobacterium xiamenense TaxID=1297121 RepID=UPI0012B7938E|nr:hypothetical protein [Cyclobacterium xiamenense]
MKYCFFPALIFVITSIQAQPSPDAIQFVRQGVKRFVFDPEQRIPLASLDPQSIIGLPAMHPVRHHRDEKAALLVENEQLIVRSEGASHTEVWFGGFNPFATYSLDLGDLRGSGALGFTFGAGSDGMRVGLEYSEGLFQDLRMEVYQDSVRVLSASIQTASIDSLAGKRLILQLLGSGLTVYLQDVGLPLAIGQGEFSQYLDLRQRDRINRFQSQVFLEISQGAVHIDRVDAYLGAGMGLADIRAITYEDGSPLLDRGRLWYTLTIRGRGLPHPLQGVFSLDPTVFDIRLEGVIVFDRNDGLLRNEVASHLFYDRREEIWKGLTTGFSAYADEDEAKQLLTISSKKDPRFGFSVMKARPFGMVGDIEDPHLIFDAAANKWRMLTCINQNGYKAILLESEEWNRGFVPLAGPVSVNSTGTSLQKIGDHRYAFFGSSERKIFIYSYPDLRERGNLQMDLPPWDAESGTRVWPNVVELPEGYPFRYLALMMDRYNYPGIQGPQWTYGAIYLYHGFD